MKIRIAGIAEETIVDGVGFRYAVFTQGCYINCPGCHNPETHDPNGGRDAHTEDLIAQFSDNPLLDGITLTGGDPFLQPEACLELAKAAHAAGLNVWAYSGQTLEMLRAMDRPHLQDLLDEIDVLVDGPYLAEKRALSMRFRGSSNQRVIDMRKTKELGTITEIE